MGLIVAPFFRGNNLWLVYTTIQVCVKLKSSDRGVPSTFKVLTRKCDRNADLFLQTSHTKEVVVLLHYHNGLLR